ncbi:MAG TPA: hypothetical protein PKN48_11590 [Bacteroidales bacterium]|nr:hypothetical protein [Bacteroidales bacterium]
MEIYSPKNSQITKFSRNVLKSEAENQAKRLEAEANSINLKFEKQKPPSKAASVKKSEPVKKDSIFKKAYDSCFNVVKGFFEYEEVV